MSPLEMVRRDCANYRNDVSCLGVRPTDLIDRGQKQASTPRESCLVSKNKRCLYFEDVVLPLADVPSPTKEPRLQSKRKKAREEYRLQTGLAIKPDKKQRYCQCGEPLEKRQRHCHKCLKDHRRKTYRREKRRQRACPTVKGHIASVSPCAATPVFSGQGLDTRKFAQQCRGRS